MYTSHAFTRKRVTLGVGAAVVAALAGVGILFATGPATGATSATALPFNSYAVKFTCGEFGKFLDPTSSNVPEGPVAPGYYQTSINVHNPEENVPVPFQKKAVLLYFGNAPVTENTVGPAGVIFPFEHDYPPGQLVSAGLKPDDALMIDCQDIRSVLLASSASAPTFIEGYVVIQVPIVRATGTKPFVPTLDVTAVYTSNGYNCVSTTAAPCAAGSTVSRSGFAQDVEVIQPTLISH